MLVSSKNNVHKIFLRDLLLGQDDLRQERPQAAFYREATSYTNTADRYVSEVDIESKLTGDKQDMESLQTITFLTRGMLYLLQ